MVAGNIGLPVLDALCDIEDSGVWPEAFVLELSSFRLEGVRSLRADAATVLNISEDHLDRYQDLLDYAQQDSDFAGDGVQVLNQDDVFCRAMGASGPRHPSLCAERAGRLWPAPRWRGGVAGGGR